VKIGVCVKVTPDTDTRIKIMGDASGIEEAGVKWIVSPYDSFAVEEAVQTKEKNKGSEVILFSACPDAHLTQLRASGLAVGGDRAGLSPVLLSSLDTLLASQVPNTLTGSAGIVVGAVGDAVGSEGGGRGEAGVLALVVADVTPGLPRTVGHRVVVEVLLFCVLTCSDTYQAR